MELEKFETKQVAAISQLQEVSNELLADAKERVIADDTDLKAANELVKRMNAHKKLVETKRLDLTQPLNNVIKQLIAKEKEVLLPLSEGKSAISTKILDYSEEIERKRIEEQHRIEKIVDTIIDHYDMRVTDVKKVDEAGAKLKEYYQKLPEADQNNPSVKVAFMTTVGNLTDRKNRILEEERAEAERIRQAEEQKRLDAERAKQSEEEARIAAERKKVDDEKRAIEEEKLQMEREKAEIEHQKELQKAEAEQLKREKEEAKKAAARPKTNQVTSTKFEITDESVVDRIYCSPDEKLIREAIKLGVKNIAGVRIYEETKVR